MHGPIRIRYFPHICAFVAFLCLPFITINHTVLYINRRQQYGLHYQHILKNVMVPSVRMLYPFTARPLLHSWFSCGSRMAIAAGRRRTPWLATASAWYEPRRENVECGEKDNAGNPPRNSDELWALVSDVWDEVASSTRYIRSLIEFTTRRMKSVVEAEWFWTSY